MTQGSKYTPADKAKFYSLRAGGWTIAAAAREVGCAYRTAVNWERPDEKSTDGKQWREMRMEQALPDVVSEHDLCDDAKRALTDFEYFRAHYLGHVSTPWQIEAATTIVELLDTPDKEYIVLNTPPGVGKSTLFTHDIPVWAIVRNRSVRIIIGSRTQRQAERYSLRIRRTLERVMPFHPPGELVEKGLACDAEGILARDYGRFRPSIKELWRTEEFVVAQPDDTLLEDKEPTVAAYGMDSGFLGNRGDLVLWDDLVDRKTLRTIDAIELQRKWWDEEAETRLEPGGLCAVIGQRMAANDLYRYCLDMEAGDPDDEDTVTGKKYRHIIYRAHDEEKCEGVHKPSLAKPQPQGCLLDPRRLPWRELAPKQRNREEVYRVQYQQEDVDPGSVLVPEVYIAGGTDPETGAMLPGCWDRERSLCEIPKGLVPPLLSYATADPSPTKFWAIEWWAYHPESSQRFLLDLHRAAMDSPDFLDWIENQRVFSGVMEEWQVRSVALGAPITHWIVEANAAQRFMLQHDHTHRWMRRHGVQIIPHQTHVNKTNDEYGVQMLKNIYRHGQVRLPGKENSRNVVLKLVDEVTHYSGGAPKGGYDDCMMAQWFGEYHLPNLELDILEPEGDEAWVPSFVADAPQGAAA